MASEGGGKIKNKRGHSSTKPYERNKSLFRRITDSIKDVLRPSWLSPEVATDDNAAVLVRAEPVPASNDHRNTGHAALAQLSLQSEAGHPSMENAEGNGPQLTQSMTGSTCGTLVRYSQSVVHGQHPNTLTNARFSWQQQQHTQHMLSTQIGQMSSPVMSVSESSQMVRGLSGLHQQPAGLMQTGAVERLRGLPPAVASSSALHPPPPRPRRLRLSESEASQPQASITHSPPSLDAAEGNLRGRAATLGGAPSSDTSTSAVENSAAKRQRLWSPETPRRGSSLQPAVHDTPAFKISVFCSPSQSMNESLHESSFYSGKTTFGGASAYRRRSLNTSLSYQNSLPLRKPVKAKPLTIASNAVLSSSATQILKTLERLSDAKRAQASGSGNDSVLSFTPSTYRRLSRPLHVAAPSRVLQVPPPGPPTGQLQSPVAASVAKNHQVATLTALRLQQRTESTSQRIVNVTRDDDDNDVQVIEDKQEGAASRNEAQSYQDSPSMSGSGKMKRAKTYETRPKARKEDDEVEVPNLRTDFTLPIQNLPAFNLGPMVSRTSTNIVKPTSTPTTAKDSSAAPALQFTFSVPIHKSGPVSSGGSPLSTEGFQFSSPLRVAQTMLPSIDKSPVSMFGGTSASTSAVTGFGPQAWGSTAPKPKTPGFGWSGDKPAPQLSEGLGASGTSSISVASASSSDSAPKPATQLMSGSVMDVLGGGKSDAAAAASPSVSSGLKPAASLRQGSVMDILGKAESSTSKSPSSTDDLFAKFKKLSGSWECGSCMVQNKPDAYKCVCCEAPKPGASSAGNITSKSQPSTDDLFTKFKKLSGSWECGSCMVQNKPDANKCVCCEAPKPGVSATAGSSQPTTAVPSGCGPDSLFAKFLKPAGAWDCDMCLVQNKVDATKCVACEAPKPGTQQPAAAPVASGQTADLFAKFRKPAGSWECDVCMVQNKEMQTRCLACESSRPGTQATGCVSKSSVETTASSSAVGPGGGLVLSVGSSSASTPSPFLTGATTQKDSTSSGLVFEGKDSFAMGFKFGSTTSSTTASSGGFKFGDTSVSSVSKAPSEGGFRLPTGGSSTAKDQSGTAGFKFGDKDLSNSNSASPAASVVFGNQGVAQSVSAPPASVSRGIKSGDSSASTGQGFQVSLAGAALPVGVGAGLSQTTVTASGFTSLTASNNLNSFGSVPATAGFSFKASSTSISKDSCTTENGVKTSITKTSVKDVEAGKPTFTPVFGLGQPSNSNSLGANPSLTLGEFQFSASASTDTSSAVFGSNLASKVKSDDGVDTKQSSTVPGTFSFQTAAKPNNEVTPQAGLFTAAGGKNGESGMVGGFMFGVGATAPTTSNIGFASPATSATTIAATPSLFSFGSTTSKTLTVTGSFGSTSQVNSWPSSENAKAVSPKTDLSIAKPAVNGEVGPGHFVFGQQAASSTTGFVFGSQNMNAAAHSSQTKQAFSFGVDSSCTVDGKRRLDDTDSGPSDAKKREFNFLGGSSSAVSAEPFNFGNPAAASTGIFSFGPTGAKGGLEKSASMPVFGGTSSGFGPSTQAGVFGENTTSQFSFSTGSAAPSNVTPGPAFPTDTAATGFSNTGFHFTPSAPSSFNFGGSSGAGSAPQSIFQFRPAAAADAGLSQPGGGGVFAFGQSSQPGDSTTPTSAFAAPSAMTFGGPPSFTIGSGEAPRKIKRAVRRGARK